MREEADKSEDKEIKDAPFVFLMNQMKYAEFQNEDHLRVPQSFSMFNRQTEFPFDPVPNVFKVAPEVDEAD